MKEYTDDQKATAHRLQREYRVEVAAAWAVANEAQVVASRAVDQAQARRDAALREVGVDVNDMGELATK